MSAPLYIRGVVFDGIENGSAQGNYKDLIFKINAFNKNDTADRSHARRELYNDKRVRYSRKDYDPVRFIGMALQDTHKGPPVGEIYDSWIEEDGNLWIEGEVTCENMKTKVINKEIEGLSIDYDKHFSEREYDCKTDHVAIVETPFSDKCRIKCSFSKYESDDFGHLEDLDIDFGIVDTPKDNNGFG